MDNSNFLVCPPPIEKRKNRRPRGVRGGKGKWTKERKKGELNSNIKIFNFPSHMLKENEISLLQRGLNFAPNCNSSLFDLEIYISTIVI